MLTAYEKYIPKKSQAKAKRAPWATTELKKLASQKLHLFEINRATGWENEPLVHQYRVLNRRVGKVSSICRKSFEKDLASDRQNYKRLFAYVNKKQKVKPRLTCLKDATGRAVSDPVEIANVLNRQFQSVFVQEGDGQLPDFEQRSQSLISNANVTVYDIFMRLQKLDGTKSPGEDKVHPHVLKNCANELALPLKIIFETSLATGTLPKAWLKANITPLPKDGSRLEPANYRPISLTSVPCKIFERLIRDHVMAHLERHSLIADQQHGFVNKKSCLTNILETLDFVTKAYSEKHSVDVIYLDFAKAFDKVPHRRLLLKLDAYGIRGNILAWIRAFLSGRTQKVVLGPASSDEVEVTSGVPQGSVLGPLLFVLYINDLPDCIVNTCKMFADDSKIIADLRPNHTVEDIETLQQDLNSVVEWTKTWLMELNVKKCKVMHIGKKNTRHEYQMNENDQAAATPHILVHTDSERDLGVQIASNLKALDQVQKASAKANRMLGMLKNTFASRDAFIWKLLYVAYVRPHVEYAVQAWNPYQLGDIRTIEKIQHRASKIPQSMKCLEYVDRCTQWNLTTLEDRRKRSDLIEQYKILHGHDLVKWHHQPSVVPARANHRERLGKELVKSCQQRRYFFCNRVASDWNALPNEVVEANSLDVFKARLDAHLSRKSHV